MRKLLIGTLMLGALCVSAFAEEDVPSPAALEQVAMSEKLIAMGKERGDAYLILAAIRLRSSLESGMPAVSDTLTSREDAVALALEAAKGNPALVAIVKDVEVSKSRRMCIYARNGVCY